MNSFYFIDFISRPKKCDIDEGNRSLQVYKNNKNLDIMLSVWQYPLDFRYCFR